MLEVVRYDPAVSTFIVAAGFETRSDWCQNIRANPRITVQCGPKRWQMTASFLSPEQAGDELLGYARRHPLALKKLAGFMGYRLDGSQASIRALGQALAMVAFHPA